MSSETLSGSPGVCVSSSRLLYDTRGEAESDTSRMSLALVATVSLGCFLMASLVLADDYPRRDVPKFAFNKGPAQRRGLNHNQYNKGGNVGRYRITYPYGRKQGSVKVVVPHNNQPGYIGSKEAHNEYNDNRQGIGLHGVQDNKGGNTDLYKSVDPCVVNQGKLTGAEVNSNQPGYTGNGPDIKNSPEYDQYNNQDNKGGNLGAYKLAGVYDGNQDGPEMVDSYNNQPGTIGGITKGDPYDKTTNNPFDGEYVDNNAPYKAFVDRNG